MLREAFDNSKNGESEYRRTGAFILQMPSSGRSQRLIGTYSDGLFCDQSAELTEKSSYESQLNRSAQFPRYTSYLERPSH